MSVLIEGVKMPKNCKECPCFNLKYDKWAWCQVKDSPLIPPYERTNWCPLVEVKSEEENG